VAAELGHWPQALADFAAVRDQDPSEVLAWRRLALAQLASGKEEAFRKTCAQFRGRFGAPPASALVGLLFAFRPGDVPGSAVLPGLAKEPFLPPSLSGRLEVVRTCVLEPRSADPPLGLLPLTDPSHELAHAAVLCRAGRHAEAVQALARRDDAIALLWRALAEAGRDRPEAARQALDQAEKWLVAPSRLDPKQTNAAQLDWEGRLEADLLRREVKARLKD
jgi:hypothetical protein